MNLRDYSTHVSIPEEAYFLGCWLFDVNMRLFGSSAGYKDLVVRIVRYMIDLMLQDFDDYDAIKGISGANIGVPFNIVVINVGEHELTETRKKVPVGILDDDIIICDNLFIPMLNPKIIKTSKKTFFTESNCGSIILDKPIQVERNEWVKVHFYNIKGEEKVIKFGKPLTGTVQHEIEHNQGILITESAFARLAKD